MSDLEAAIAAEMRLAGCSPSKVDDCREHPNDGRWSDRDACPVVAAAVCAGWDAAINAVAEAIGRKQPRWGVTSDYDRGFLDGWDDHQTAIGREVRALLSEGGGRDE